MLIPEEVKQLLKTLNLYKNEEDFYNSFKGKYITKKLKIDPLGYIEHKRKIHIREIQLKESLEHLPHKELIEKYMKMPIKNNTSNISIWKTT